MSYAARSDIEDLFGKENVSKWADLDGFGSDTDIAARVTKSLAVAEDSVDNHLRGGPYAIPIILTVPEAVVDITAKLAGVWLYRARGVSDFDPDSGSPEDRMKWFDGSAKRDLKMIRALMLRLDLPLIQTTTPQVVEIT